MDDKLSETVQNDMKEHIKTPQQEIDELKERVAELERRVYGYVPPQQLKPEPARATKPVYIEQKPVSSAVSPVEKPKLSETNVGKYGVGILAGVLVLLAVAIGIRSYWEFIPDVIKFAVILIGGNVIETFGWINLRKTGKKNGFWSSITGTGAAVAFVAIVAGNLAWSIYGLIPAGLLLIAWFSVNFLLAMRADSVVFYSVAYIGGVVSVLLAALKLREGIDLGGEIGMIIIIAVITAFGIVQRNKNSILPFFNFAFGAVSSVLILWTVYGGFDADDGAMPLAIGLLMITSMLLFEASRLSKDTRIVNAIASFIAAFGVFVSCYNVFIPYLTISNEAKESIFASVCFVLSVAIVLIANKEVNVNIFAVSPFAAAALCYLSKNTLGAESIIPATFVAILLEFPTRKNAYLRLSAYITFFISLWANLDNSYGYNNTLLTISCIVLLVPCIVEYIMTILDKNMKLSKTIGVIALISAFLSVVQIDFEVMWKILGFVFTIIFHRIVIMPKINKKEPDSIAAWILIYLALFLTHIIVYIYAIFNDSDLVKSLTAVILISLTVTGIYEAVRYKSVMLAILYVVLTNINISYLTSLLVDSDAVLIVSIVGIVFAAVFIGIGFATRMKSLRILGLVSMLIYVLKICFFDVPHLGGTGVNVLLLLGGGVVCFGISFAYNRLDKVFANKETISE